MEKQDSLYKLVLSVQQNQNDSKRNDNLIELLEKFRPLILKYKHMLKYEDAEYDLVLFFIEMIDSIKLEGFDENNSNYQLLSYFSLAMRNKYISLSKAKYQKVKILELEEWYYEEPSYSQEQNIEILELLNHLQTREKQIIVMKYWYGYSDFEVGSKMNITRQTVNRIVRRSLDKMREYVC